MKIWVDIILEIQIVYNHQWETTYEAGHRFLLTRGTALWYDLTIEGKRSHALVSSLKERQIVMETSPVVPVAKIFVIDNRVRVYADGKNQSAYSEHGSYLIAVEEAKRIQKETYPNATINLNPPKEKCKTHYAFMQQEIKGKESAIKSKAKRAKKVDKMKVSLEKEIAEMAILEGKTVEEVKAEMGIV